MQILTALIITIFGTGVIFWLRHRTFVKKQIERSLKMVPLEIKVPPATKEEQEKFEDTYRKTIAAAENIFGALTSIYKFRFKTLLTGGKHIALELVADGRHLKVYVAVPVSIVELVEKAILGVYPEAEINEVTEHNIFSAGTTPEHVAGGELKLKRSAAFPIRTYQALESDVLQSITTSLTQLELDEGAAVQILVRPVGNAWRARANTYIKMIRKGRRPVGNWTDFYSRIFQFGGEVGKSGTAHKGELKPGYEVTPQDEEMIQGLSAKAAKPGFAAAIRIIAASPKPHRPAQLVEEIRSSFAILNHPSMNGFYFRPRSPKSLATDFIFRFFPPYSRMILNSEELATIFHLQQAVETPHLAYAPSKKAPAPADLPADGILIGRNEFRGEAREVKLSTDDRRRHAYILGQTGTGKTTLLLNMILQDVKDGQGVCVVDPHGDLIETILGHIPRERAQDVVLFDPGDLDRPMGLNLFEFKRPEQKDFLIQESINMLYRLYDPGHTGIIGPRYEHWFRNAALTLMSDPAGATFIEVPKVFTDDDYLREKLTHVTDQMVIDFWTKEMAQTSDFHKSEVLGWFVSKFGAFMSNEMMRNIIGQKKSSFDLREIMDKKKILLVNLSKGKVGELNSMLLGMIFITKAQVAAMSRVDQPEAERVDFTMYVDEFQNFATDSFATILSEARKYRLNLIVANQFIGQLRPDIKDAVFGNVGTVVTLRVGPDDAAYMARQLTPVFNEQDLIQLENFNSALRLMIKGVPSRPFSMRVIKPWEEKAGFAPDTELAEYIRGLSRTNFGRDKAQVVGEIQKYIGAGYGDAGTEGETLKG